MARAYALGRTDPEIGPPNSADMLAGQAQSAMPSLESGSPYIDAFGWAPKLKDSQISVPDSARLQQAPLREYYPDPTKPEKQGFYSDRDAEKKARHSVENVKADAQVPEIKSGIGLPDPALGANRWARNPREIPPPEPRITTRLSPITYIFTRPFMHGLPKNIRPHLDGIHFSMADHKLGKAYNSTGMAPQRQPGKGTRNTYRLTPTPWDSRITDMPPEQPAQPQVAATVSSIIRRGRSWRLT